jgi:putative membrane protein
MMLDSRSASIARRSSLPGPRMWSCPAMSSKVRGRIRAAKGRREADCPAFRPAAVRINRSWKVRTRMPKTGPSPNLFLRVPAGIGYACGTMKNKLPIVLFALYLVEFAVLAIRIPVSRPTWIAENVTVLCHRVPLVWMYLKGIRFSNTAYLFMSVLIFLHTIGGHYTFSEVPFGWVTDLIGAERNHFDRIAHFSVGFYAFGIMELIESRRLSTHRGFSVGFALALIFAVASLFEIVEWLYAVSADPVAGAEFLGSQGDVWDAQKDMLADGLGAVLAVVVYQLVYRGRFPAPRPA